MSDYLKLAEECNADFVIRTTTGITTIYDISFEQDPYARIDCIISSGFTSYACELKKRKWSHLKTWNNQPGFVFEEIKFLALNAHKAPNKLYIILFLDATVVFNIGEMDLKFHDESLSSTHERSKKKKKSVTYLTLDRASHIILNKGLATTM